MLDTMQKKDEDYEALKKLIHKKLGFNCEQYKDSHFKRRIDVRLRATNSKNYKDYLNALQSNKDEWPELMETLTVNVTNFFRNPEVYDLIEKDVLPAIIKAKSTGLRSIRIWSAGCSIGVEAYSIAMLLHHILGDEFKKYNIKITGTDIDKDSLAKAQKGLYSSLEIKDVRPAFLKKYFTKEGNDYVINDELKKIAQFRKQDLISGPKMSGFDAVFCRNVTIYFQKELQEQLYMDFYNALSKDGFFVMGKTETLLGPSKDMFKAYNSKERIYQK
ncbi:CheR family methyltransferase [Methanolobus profundi]|uniref:protein-glutamate O-methyltransferase n=1 Tax=Methanolobus profundi TaxID=487685 RepID=A0A1I4NJS9_9EURY|nr:protein-glutamate O-methyltransferase CheR [Methanolobus profundi]SFM15719.1 chemotaxis protein methyltransferase CheR [Methanolobus profundi]